MSLRTADYDYQFPDELIAPYPAERRDESRMMLVESESQRVANFWFGDFVELPRPDELVVLNNTKVVPV
jgi:S-adenosylmethionine:tRNA ribosyltransferase-isomerase